MIFLRCIRLYGQSVSHANIHKFTSRFAAPNLPHCEQRETLALVIQINLDHAIAEAAEVKCISVKKYYKKHIIVGNNDSAAKGPCF